jgi:hypothetical protein
MSYYQKKKKKESKNFKFIINKNFHIFFVSLKSYLFKYGNINVPIDFIVPFLNPNSLDKGLGEWPIECCGFKLGKVLEKVVRTSGINYFFPESQEKKKYLKYSNSSFNLSYEEFINIKKSQALEYLNQVPSLKLVNHPNKFETICKALIFHNHLYGDMLVPRYFIVPKTENFWPVR